MLPSYAEFISSINSKKRRRKNNKIKAKLSRLEQKREKKLKFWDSNEKRSESVERSVVVKMVKVAQKK